MEMSCTTQLPERRLGGNMVLEIPGQPVELWTTSTLIVGSPRRACSMAWN